MKKTLTFRTPAKINLYLKLTGKRKDGYNNICTVFQKISLYDTISIAKQKRGFSLEVTGSVPCTVKENLMYKAYYLVKSQIRFSGGISIVLQKNIPVGAGLGGASSDAAYTLIGINSLYNLRLNLNDLANLGSRIGADVPLFIYPYTSALGIERGDMLVNFGLKSKFWVLLIIFDASLSTKRVYKKYQYPITTRINLTKVRREVIMLSQFFSQRNILSLGSFLKNDLCRSAFSLMPEVQKIIRFLRQ